MVNIIAKMHNTAVPQETHGKYLIEQFRENPFLPVLYLIFCFSCECSHRFQFPPIRQSI